MASTTLESDSEASTQEGDCIVVGAVGGVGLVKGVAESGGSGK